ncbi:MAG: hypothetical protein RL701_365 [Pseudomonadota bacterium]
MHDLDRTLGRTSLEAGFSGNQQHEEEYEFSSEQEYESEQEVLHEDELDELAAELLEVSSEQELEQFLGGLIKKVGSAAGKFIRSPIGRQVGGLLKGAAKKALPIVGAAIGNYVAPGVGGAIGSKLASTAGSLFGLELEGLSYEDGEFEVAKQFVRFAADAANNAVNAPANGNVRELANEAVTSAAQKFAPGLLNGSHAPQQQQQQSHAAHASGAQSGRWVRRGRQLIIYGA